MMIMVPTAMAVARMRGVDGDGQRLGGAGAQQNQREGGDDQFFHGMSLDELKRPAPGPGSMMGELVISPRLTDAGKKKKGGGDGGDTD
jgi:hypothetical protein